MADLDDLPIVAYAARADGTLTFANKQFYLQTGTSPEAPLAAAWADAMHPDDRQATAERWSAAVAAGAPYDHEVRIRLADGTYRWYISRALPTRDPATGSLTGYLGTASDIDRRRKAEADLRDLIALHENVSARERLYARFGEELSGALSLDETVDVMLRLVVPAFADWMSVYVERRDGNGFEVIAMRHWDEARRPIVDELLGTTFATESSVTAEVLRTGRPVLLARYPEELRERSIHPRYAAHLRALGLRSAIVVPFKFRGKVIGAIHAIRGDNPIDFGRNDLLLIEELARRITPAIHNAELYERERLVARRFQEAALPAMLPDVAGFAFDAVYEAAQSEAHIGGDWYDAFQLNDGRVVVSIGDVAGHGLDAAVTMSSVRQSLRAAALIEPDPIRMLRAVDGIVRGLDRELFVTAFVGIIDSLSLELTFAGAGHPPPLVRCPDGAIKPLESSGPPLGLYEAGDRVASVECLEPGCIVALYTDGLTEFDRDPLEGERQLAAALAADGGRETAHAIYRRIVAGRPARDDIAILTVRLRLPSEVQ